MIKPGLLESLSLSLSLGLRLTVYSSSFLHGYILSLLSCVEFLEDKVPGGYVIPRKHGDGLEEDSVVETWGPWSSTVPSMGHIKFVG
jgi:hypothetical protein